MSLVSSLFLHSSKPPTAAGGFGRNRLDKVSGAEADGTEKVAQQKNYRHVREDRIILKDPNIDTYCDVKWKLHISELLREQQTFYSEMYFGDL